MFKTQTDAAFQTKSEIVISQLKSSWTGFIIILPDYEQNILNIDFNLISYHLQHVPP